MSDDNIVQVAEKYESIKSETLKWKSELSKLETSRPLLFGKKQHEAQIDEVQSNLNKAQGELKIFQLEIDEKIEGWYDEFRMAIKAIGPVADEPHKIRAHMEALSATFQLLQKMDTQQERKDIAEFIYSWALYEFGGLSARRRVDNIKPLAQRAVEKYVKYETDDLLACCAIGFLHLKFGQILVASLQNTPTLLSNEYLDNAIYYFDKVLNSKLPEGDLNYHALAKAYYKDLKEYYY